MSIHHINDCFRGSIALSGWLDTLPERHLKLRTIAPPKGRDLTDNVAPEYTDSRIVEETQAPFSIARRTMAVAAGWLVPGAGHLILSRYKRGLLFLGVIVGSFVFGLLLQGRLFWPTPSEPTSRLPVDLISVLWSFAQLGSGICYLGSLALGLGVTPHAEATTFEYGNTFMFLAGLLNYLVVHDAFDIAAGRKE